MTGSLLGRLPGILATGRREAAQALDRADGEALRTVEVVIPAGAVPEPASGAPGNRLIHGDNLQVAAALLTGDRQTPTLRGRASLVYLDPPFASRAHYRARSVLPGADSDEPPTVVEQVAYSDTWAEGTAAYLAMLTPRLVLARDLLRDDGALYVHLDWHVGHYVKLLLDEIFGVDNFRNEIVWHYSGWNKRLRTSFERRHDTIFYYSRGSRPRFHSYFQDWASKEEYVRRRKQKVLTDPTGREYVLSDAGGGRRVPRYLDDVLTEGVAVDDVWDLDKLNNSAAEVVGYDTQKPRALLERIVTASSAPGDLVVDLFAGAGTTAVVAEASGRNWVAVDDGALAATTTRRRLVAAGARPFLYQTVDDDPPVRGRTAFGRGRRARDLSRSALDRYGAEPLPADENAECALGRVPGTRTLVVADSPTRPTTVESVRRAVALRDEDPGGFDRVVVLGWRFPHRIAREIVELADDRLDVLVVPPELPQRGPVAGRRPARVGFRSLRALDARVDRVADPDDADRDLLHVELTGWRMLSPDAVDLDAATRAEVCRVLDTDPLALIDYWAVDPDHDGQVFRSLWQGYRGDPAGGRGALRVTATAAVAVPRRPGPRNVCVRAVDVLGCEAQVVLAAPAPSR